MAIDEIILHIGMHKTGTTAIQEALVGYDDGRIAYADLRIWGDREPNHGNAIETLYRADFENIPLHRRLGRSRAQVAGYRALYRTRFERALAVDRQRLILSGEAIPRLRRAELETLRDTLLAHARRVTVIAYIREPVGFVSSMFQQRCRLGHLAPEDPLPLPRYRARFAKFRKVFGTQNVTFVKFERASLRGGSIVTDFAHRVGITGDLAARVSNERLSGDATRLLYLLLTRHAEECRRVDHVRPLSQTVRFLQDGVTGPAFVLPRPHIEARLKAGDIAWMERAAGFVLREEAPAAPLAQDLETDLARITPEGLDQLRAAMQAAGMRADPAATPADLMRQVYRHHCRRLRPEILARRAVDTGVALARLALRR